MRKYLAQKFRFLRNAIASRVPGLLLSYHYLLAVASIVLYRHPSRHLIVIGVTGTKGKTTTALFIHAALVASGEKVGLLSTAALSTGGAVHPNTLHMTMPGRGFTQNRLREMVSAGCAYAVIETPSEGIRQFRALGVRYDALVFTGLSPEHLVTHKTFERYRAVKGSIFKTLASSPEKKIRGESVSKFAVLNADDEHVTYFAAASKSPRVKQLLFGIGSGAAARAKEVRPSGSGSEFLFDGHRYRVPFPGAITVRNALPAIVLAKAYGSVSAERVNEALSSVVIPGRMEEIRTDLGFRVFCDYAHEPLSIASVYEALRRYVAPGGRVIMVVGAVGDSRWRHNAEEIGDTAARLADVVIITDVDPYHDDPEIIAAAVAKGAGRRADTETHVETDRRKGIRKALATARDGDVVIVTGKGSETTMRVRGNQLPWDERAIIREESRRVSSEREGD